MVSPPSGDPLSQPARDRASRRSCEVSGDSQSALIGFPETGFSLVSITPTKGTSMLDSSKRTIATLTAAACLGAGGWAMAASTSGTATTSSTAASTSAATTTAQGQYGPPQGAPQNGQPGQSFPGEKLLTGDDAAKAKAAALAKLPGATIVRVETDANDGGAYEAHVTKSDGSQAIVLMDKNFTVTSVVSH